MSEGSQEKETLCQQQGQRHGVQANIVAAEARHHRVHQQLAQDCSADAMLKHDTDLHEERLAQGKKMKWEKRKTPINTKNPPQTYTAASVCSVPSATLAAVVEASYYAITI